MPSESDLRSRMREPEEPAGPATPADAIDLGRVIRRSRARRLPRMLAIGGVACLTVIGIGVPVTVSALGGPGGGTLFVAADGAGSAADEGSAKDAQLPESSSGTELSGRAPADKLNLCTGMVAEVAPAASGLVLTVAPVEAAAGAASVDAVVTLTNTGTATVRGTTGGTPALTLSQDGLVLWHSNGPTTMIAVEVDLAPGESLEYPASFRPVRCGVDDDANPEGFRDALPSLPPGDYALSAAIDLTPIDGGAIELVTGPTTAVVLR